MAGGTESGNDPSRTRVSAAFPLLLLRLSSWSSSVSPVFVFCCVFFFYCFGHFGVLNSREVVVRCVRKNVLK